MSGWCRPSRQARACCVLRVACEFLSFGRLVSSSSEVGSVPTTENSESNARRVEASSSFRFRSPSDCHLSHPSSLPTIAAAASFTTMASNRDSMDVDQPTATTSGVTIEDLLSSRSNAYSATDAALSAQLDARKLARSLAVPTSDPKVRLRLRQLGEPVTCFGEREMDRRERLVEIVNVPLVRPVHFQLAALPLARQPR